MIAKEAKENRVNIHLSIWGMLVVPLIFLPQVYLNKTWFAPIGNCMWFMQFIFTIRFYIVRGIARAWNQSGMMMALTIGIIVAYLSIDDLSKGVNMYANIFLWCIYFISFPSLWRFSKTYMEKAIEGIKQHGRYDFQQGIFWPFVMIPPETKFGQWLVAIGPILGGLAIYLGFYFRVTHADIEKLVTGIMGYAVGFVFLFAASCAYYELQFIRRWEKETGRIMYVAGFGPTAEEKRE